MCLYPLCVPCVFCVILSGPPPPPIRPRFRVVLVCSSVCVRSVSCSLYCVVFALVGVVLCLGRVGTSLGMFF